MAPADPWSELRLRRVALPAALALAFLVDGRHGAGMSRVFLTMWVHELGHAVTAWLCGFGAFPGPWRTPVSEGRLPLVTVAVLGALGYAGYRAWQAAARGAIAGLAVVLVAQLVLTFGVRAHTA